MAKKTHSPASLCAALNDAHRSVNQLVCILINLDYFDVISTLFMLISFYY